MSGGGVRKAETTKSAAGIWYSSRVLVHQPNSIEELIQDTKSSIKHAGMKGYEKIRMQNDKLRKASMQHKEIRKWRKQDNLLN